MSGSGGAGAHRTPHGEERARERRMRYSAKKRVEQAELALHRYRAKAAAILHAEGLHGSGEEPHSTYVFKILRHRESGVRVRVLDTQAADAPPPAEGADVVHRYAVQCQTHSTRGPSFASARSALAAARRSYEWCAQCAGLTSASARPRGRSGAAGDPGSGDPGSGDPGNGRSGSGKAGSGRSGSGKAGNGKSGSGKAPNGRHARRRDDIRP